MGRRRGERLSTTSTGRRRSRARRSRCVGDLKRLGWRPASEHDVSRSSALTRATLPVRRWRGGWASQRLSATSPGRRRSRARRSRCVGELPRLAIWAQGSGSLSATRPGRRRSRARRSRSVGEVQSLEHHEGVRRAVVEASAPCWLRRMYVYRCERFIYC